MRLNPFAALLRRGLINLDTGSETPPAPPPVDPPAEAPVVPPVDPPADPPVEDPPAEPTAEEIAAAAAEKVTAIKTALKLPDNPVLDDAALERTAAIASELGLSPEAAQRVLELAHQEAASQRQAVLDSFAFEGSEWTRLNDTLRDAALADPDIGAGSTEKLTAAAEKAKRGMAALFGDQTAAVEDALTKSGIASSPVLVKAFMRVADRMAEAPFHKGTAAGTNVGKRAADILYGDPPAPT